jgi:F0F1-type ATP synthase assembly protein I
MFAICLVPGAPPEEGITRQERGRGQDAVRDAAQYLGHGLTLVASTVLFLFLGWWLDAWLGSVPLFTILGAFVGGGAGFYHMVQRLNAKRNADERERRRR